MTGVMIIFAFVLSLVINLFERTVIPHDDLFSQKRLEEKETETANKPE